jgi:uncharacterized repeat protein (TIGR04138 family)
MRDDAPGQSSPFPDADDKLHSILTKIISYQHLRANGAAVELEELKREKVLSPDELAFMVERGVVYKPYRTADYYHAGDMLQMPTKEGCVLVGPDGPKQKKRSALLRDFRAILESLLQLPSEGLMIHVELSDRDGMGISPALIIFRFETERWKERLEFIREVGRQHELEALQDAEVQCGWMLGFRHALAGTALADLAVALLGRGCGFEDQTEVNYSCGALDQGDPDYLPEEEASVSEDEYHAWMFVDKCVQTALKRVDKPGCHVGALEILAVAPQVARELFGEDAVAILRSAGIHSSATLGKLIFELIELERFSKTKEDSIDDFNVVGTFDDLFEK